MPSLLHVNSSARREGSLTRQFGESFVARWKAAHPGGTVIERDVAAEPLPHLTEDMVSAFFTPAEYRSPEAIALLRTSDMLVDELLAADTVVIGAPMYNLSVPSALKAWIDHVARAGRTFKYDGVTPQGLVRGKRVIVIASTGGNVTQEPLSAIDHVQPFMRAFLAYLGMVDVTFVVTPGVAMGEVPLAAAIAKGEREISALSV